MSNNITKTKSSEVKIAPNLKKQNLFEVICSYGVTILSLLFFGYIAIMSVFQTSTLDPVNFSGEHILFEDDDFAMNFFLIGAFFLAVFALSRFANIFLKVNEKILTACLAVYTVTLGFIWIFMAQSIPAADSGVVYSTATDLVKNDWTSFFTSNNDFYNNISYFQIYPFQLGFVLISEFVYRISGAESAMVMQVLNVLSLAAMYVGIVMVNKKLFKSKAVTFITVFMLAGCIQPIFFTTFVYGNIIGLAAAIWACYFVIKFMKGSDKKSYLMLLPATALITLSVIAKYNNMIWLAAICIGLVIYAIREKKWLSLVSVVFVAAVAVGSFNLVIYSYEKRSGAELGDGVTQLLYLDAGINESAMAPGWYNDMSKTMYLNADCDTEKAEADAKADIDAKLEEFKNDPDYAKDFFKKKITSQWNEPSFECIWVSQVKGHYNGDVVDGTLLNSVYNGNWNKFFYDYFDFFHMITFILFAIGMIGLIRKKCGAETIMFLTALIGGFLYHTLFEAKSQYILTYFIIIVMFASYGLYFLLKPRSFNTKRADGKKTISDHIANIANKIDSKTR